MSRRAYRIWIAGRARDIVRLRPLRELRHAVSNAGRGASDSRNSIATPGSIGVTYYPDPDIAVKVDYVMRTATRARVDHRRRTRSTSGLAGGSDARMFTWMLSCRVAADWRWSRLRRPCGRAAARDRTRSIRITAERFVVHAVGDQASQVGDDVELRAQERRHDARLPHVGTDVNVAIPKRGRGEVTVSFTADTAGRYTFECNAHVRRGTRLHAGRDHRRRAGQRRSK